MIEYFRLNIQGLPADRFLKTYQTNDGAEGLPQLFNLQ